MTPLTVVIPTLNEEKTIGETLGALAPQLRKGDEIIIVDSRSKDKTVSIARKHGCKIIFLPRCGIGKAKTEGAKRAKNSIVAMLDADGVPASDWLPRIRNHFQDKETAAVVGLGVYQGGSFSYDVFAEVTFFLGRFSYFLFGLPWLPANNSAILKKVFLEKGGYPNVVCEDMAFGKRARGLKGVVYDKAMRVTLSTRRFERDGFVKTVVQWVWSDINVMLGRGVSGLDYETVR